MFGFRSEQWYNRHMTEKQEVAQQPADKVEDMDNVPQPAAVDEGEQAPPSNPAK